MDIFAVNKAKNWFERRLQTVSKNNKIKIGILIIISGFFFYSNVLAYSPEFYTNSSIPNQKEEEMQISYNFERVGNINDSQDKADWIARKTGLRFPKGSSQKSIEKKLNELVGDAPIREMIPEIAKLEDRVGAFTIGIAKKESDWGNHAPTKDESDCYNYWGYKGAGSQGASMGYACFGSPEEAVKTVGRRISELVDKKLDSPAKFVVWKCGSSCAGHDPAGVQKWISDVNLYFGKVMKIRNS